MSQLTHTQPRPLQFRLPLWLTLAAVALIAGAAIALFFALSADDEAIQTPNAAAVSDTAAGIRYDGGPEEGTTGITPPGPAEGIRYDGGPEEGTSGVRPAPPASKPDSSTSSAGIRYDGGPEEGTSGVHGSSPGASTTPGIRYDGGPEEGATLAR